MLAGQRKFTIKPCREEMFIAVLALLRRTLRGDLQAIRDFPCEAAKFIMKIIRFGLPSPAHAGAFFKTSHLVERADVAARELARMRGCDYLAVRLRAKLDGERHLLGRMEEGFRFFIEDQRVVRREDGIILLALVLDFVAVAGFAFRAATCAFSFFFSSSLIF